MSDDKLLYEFPYDTIIGGADKITSDYLVEQFKNMILSDIFPSGYMFPNENTLCEQLGIGRSTLREAFKVLSAYGLITRTKHGTFINDSKDFSSSFLINYNFQESDPIELMEFRKIFESETAYLAAQKATTDDIMELKKLLIKIESCKNNISALSFHDVAFHYRIAYCTQNKLLICIMKLISDTYYKGIRKQFEEIDRIGDRSTYEATLYYHTKIFDAILLKNSETASSMMRDHLDSALQELIKMDKNKNISVK